MDELARQVAVLQTDMAWVKGILNILLLTVVGLGIANVGLTAWNVRNGKKK